MTLAVDPAPPAPTVMPVSVLVERQPVTGNPWVSERWVAVGVVAGERFSERHRSRTLIRSDAGGDQYLWRGFALELFRDDAPGYYANLMSDHPSVFVVCHERDDADEDAPAGLAEGEIEPFLTTVSYGEASAYMETDEPVFATPMPPEVYRWLEAYVLEHYVPEPGKKRRRVDWKRGEGGR